MLEWLLCPGCAPGFSQPFSQLWAPLPHVGQQHLSGDISQHVVYIPGGTSLLFSYEFRATASGIATRWQEWLPRAVQRSAMLICPVAFVLSLVHDSIRNEMPVCPSGTKLLTLLPALTPNGFPTVIVAKVNFAPMMVVGAVFAPDLLNRIRLIRHLGLEGMYVSP